MIHLSRLTFSITPDEALVETRQKLVKEKIFGSILEKILTFGHIYEQLSNNVKVYRQFSTVLCTRDAYPKKCPGGCSLWQKENPFFQVVYENKSMPVNGSEHPMYHLKCIGPEPQGRGATWDEALTQNN